MNKLLAIATAALVAAGTAQASTPVVVDALGDAYGTSGATAVTLHAGEAFTVTVDPADLWSAGALPRWSNADGLTHNLFATGSDESGQAAGTLIGQNWGTYSTADGSFAYGELVGRIGAGPYFAVGTSFSGVASSAGTLTLYYWDSYTADNAGSVTAEVSAVPEPASAALMLAGFAALAGVARRRAAKKSA
jgi:hypothetical protein